MSIWGNTCSLWVPQSEQQLTTKIASICPYDTLLRIWNVIYTNFSLWWKIYFLSLSVSQNLKIPKMGFEKRKFGGKSQILPKSWKINKCWFLWQILRQFCSLDPKVPCLWILWSYDSFWANYDILNWKKKKNVKFFFKPKSRAYSISIFFFCGHFLVLFFFEKFWKFFLV